MEISNNRIKVTSMKTFAKFFLHFSLVILSCLTAGCTSEVETIGGRALYLSGAFRLPFGCRNPARGCFPSRTESGRGRRENKCGVLPPQGFIHQVLLRSQSNRNG